MAASAYQEDDQDQTTIQISANKRFRLQNAEGKYLEYDGNNYTGDMKFIPANKVIGKVSIQSGILEWRQAIHLN